MSDIHENIDTTTSSTLYANATAASDRGKQLYSRKGDTADEIDPRKLLRNPELSELRWYYRRTLAGVLVDKPVDDAFKNGLDFIGQDESRANNAIEDVDYFENYKLADKKARRDGFALLFLGTRDNSAGVHQSMFDDDVIVEEFTHSKVFTVDDLCQCAAADVIEDIKVSHPALDMSDIEVRQSGMVINRDITSTEYGNPIGYTLDQGRDANGVPSYQFIHQSRVQHLVWNEEVDGDYKQDDHNVSPNRWRAERPLGKWEGDSILVASYDLLKGLTKGNWSIMQAVYRNASNMYVVHMPRDADEGEFKTADREFTNMNAKSEFVVPGGPPGHDEDTYQVEQYTSGDMLEPQEHFDIIFSQLCAVHEMTKSVLFGTQSGVVSGSETDIKNYFNQVERYRQGRVKRHIKDYLNRYVRATDGRTSETAEMSVDIEWGPMFRLSKEDEFDVFFTQAQAVSMLVNGYVITPDEARSILTEEWADLDLGSLSESDLDKLDRVNLSQVGAWQGAERNEPDEERGNVNEQNGGGMEQGQQTSQFADSIDEELVDKIADKVAEKLTESE